MRYCVRIGLLLLAVLLVPPSPAWLPASSEGGHGSESKKGDKKEAGKAVDGVIDIGSLVVNILSTKGYKFLRLGMQVRCKDNEAAERLLKPDAREELIFTLSSKVAEDLLTNAGKMVLRKELLELFSKYAGEGKVQDLYFTEFVFQ
jgi:flagellar protein FliL